MLNLTLLGLLASSGFTYGHSDFQPHSPLISFDFESQKVNTYDLSSKQIECFLNQKLNSATLGYSVNEHTTWSISGSNFSQSGKGLTLFDLEFPFSGDFVLKLHTHEAHGSCEHVADIEFLIHVLPFSIRFNLDAISLSSPIRGGENSLTVSIPVELESTSEVAFPLNALSIKSAGVNTSLSGKFMRSEVDSEDRIQRVEFSLEGSCDSGTYIMLDFYFNNRIIGTYYVPSKTN